MILLKFTLSTFLKKDNHVTCHEKKVTDQVYIEEKTGPVRGNLPKEIISGVQIFPIKHKLRRWTALEGRNFHTMWAFSYFYSNLVESQLTRASGKLGYFRFSRLSLNGLRKKERPLVLHHP